MQSTKCKLLVPPQQMSNFQRRATSRDVFRVYYRVWKEIWFMMTQEKEKCLQVFYFKLYCRWVPLNSTWTIWMVFHIISMSNITDPLINKICYICWFYLQDKNVYEDFIGKKSLQRNTFPDSFSFQVECGLGEGFKVSYYSKINWLSIL